MGALFSKYAEIEEVKDIIVKSGRATGDMELHVTLMRKSFGEIQNILLCREKRVLVVRWKARHTAVGHVVPRDTWARSASPNILNSSSSNSSSSSCSTSKGRNSCEGPQWYLEGG